MGHPAFVAGVALPDLVLNRHFSRGHYSRDYWFPRTLARCVSACLAAPSRAFAWGR
jgi:hypothetical protein